MINTAQNTIIERTAAVLITPLATLTTNRHRRSDMAANKLPPRELLLKLFIYDEDKGHLIWRERTPDTFDGGVRGAATICKIWNTKYAGQQAGFTKKACGALRYTVVKVNYVGYYVHRIIWFMVKGEDRPDLGVDHIDGNGLNNRLDNLRLVTQQTNCMNRRIRKNNNTGLKGSLPHKVTLRAELYTAFMDWWRVNQRQGTWRHLSRRLTDRRELPVDSTACDHMAERQGVHG